MIDHLSQMYTIEFFVYPFLVIFLEIYSIKLWVPNPDILNTKPGNY